MYFHLPSNQEVLKQRVSGMFKKSHSFWGTPSHSQPVFLNIQDCAMKKAQSSTVLNVTKDPDSFFFLKNSSPIKSLVLLTFFLFFFFKTASESFSSLTLPAMAGG